MSANSATIPAVSFVVPCYNLAHLLGECLESILSQTYRDLEILVMDDCSPDGTGEVVRAFDDPRLRYVRNPTNLGHLKNYNKGLSLARGKYVWLISADDYLRRPYALQKYVQLMERDRTLGYVFCAGVGVRDGREVGPWSAAAHGRHDRLFKGHAFLRKLFKWNCVLAASGMCRRELYENVSLFPEDMPWAGDWYLWSLFAMHSNVAYFAEPMVCYRVHEASMTTALTSAKLDACAAEEVRMSWEVRTHALQSGYDDIGRECLMAVVSTYVRTLASSLYRKSRSFMRLDSFEESLASQSISASERDWVRARVYAGVANECYWRNELARASELYRVALGIDSSLHSVRFKLLLLTSGRIGDYARRAIRIARAERVAVER